MAFFAERQRTVDMADEDVGKLLPLPRAGSGATEPPGRNCRKDETS